MPSEQMKAIEGLEAENDHELRQLVRISWLYYMEGLTQQQIADRLNLSRIKVNRLLQHAHKIGVVQITINGPNTPLVELEQEICGAFDLRDASVVMEADPGPALYQRLAEGAAAWLEPRLQPGISVGLSLGRTISFLPTVFRPAGNVDCSFTEIIAGASDHTGSFQSYNVTSRMAELVGGQASYWSAPTVVSNRELYQMLMNETQVAEALERARRCDIALQSIGTVNEEALLYKAGYLTAEDMAVMRAAGAVGDVLGRFIDRDGEPVPNPLEERILALSLDDLRAIPWSVCVAGGPDKVDAIFAAVRARIFNVLITDAVTARMLLSRLGEG